MLAPIDALVALVHPSLLALAGVLDPVTGGAGAALAVVVLTCTVRLLLVPLSWRQARTQARVRALGPQLDALRARWRHDPQRLSREVRRVHREGGVSPLGLLGVALVQAPVLWVVYRLCSASTVGGSANELLTATLLGVPLSARWVGVGLSGDAAVFVVVAVVALLVAWWSARGLRRSGADGAPGLVRLLAYGVVVVVPFVPLAVGLYLVTSAAWTAGERVVLAWFGVG